MLKTLITIKKDQKYFIKGNKLNPYKYFKIKYNNCVVINIYNPVKLYSFLVLYFVVKPCPFLGGINLAPTN